MSKEEEKVFTSIAEIDAALEEEFNKTVVEPVVKTEEIPLDPTKPTEVIPPVDPAKPAEPAVVVPPAPVVTEPAKPAKPDQQEYKFSQMRKEKDDALKALSEKESLLSRLAAVSGFDSVEEYQKSLETRIIEEEAKKTGLPPETYRELDTTKKQLKELQDRNQILEQQGKIANFSSEIAKVVNEYGFDQTIGDTVIKRFTELGYTLETLLAVPHPDVLIRGVLISEIQEKSKAIIDNTARIAAVDTNSIVTATPTPVTIDDILDAEMEAYARSRNIKIPKK